MCLFAPRFSWTPPEHSWPLAALTRASVFLNMILGNV